MNMQEIKKHINKQKDEMLNLKGVYYENMREVIEDEFLSSNDIANKSDEFDEDIDIVEVENLRAEAMIDVLNNYNL